MGIRFACHVCSKRLNIKQELAGRRGICPACSAKFRIPLHDAEKSIPIDSPRPINGQAEAGQSMAGGNQAGGHQAGGHQAGGHQAGGHQAGGNQADGHQSVAQASQPQADIDLIDDDSTSTWYVRPPSGGQYGPATGEILRQWINEGRVAATSLLWREGWPQWREAKEALPQLAGRLPDSGSEPTLAATRVSSREADEFGFGATLNSEAAESVVSSLDTAYQPNGRADVGSDRRVRSDYRTMTITILTVLAVGLVFALAFVLSR